MMYNILRIPNDFKFSEEVILISNNTIPTLDKEKDFNIRFTENKNCKITPDNPLIPDTTVCRNCYYKAFAEKMLAVRKSKRKYFVEFQMNLRKDKIKFLKELDELLVDCESYFNFKDMTQYDYRNAIEDLIGSDSVNESIEKESSENHIDTSFIKMIETYIPKQYKLDIFISHSSLDKAIATKLIKILKEALNLKSERIRCTSVSGYKLTGGVNTDEQLRTEIEDNNVFIGIISENSIKSNYVLFELGARWGLNRPFKPVITKKEDLSFLNAPLNNMQILNLSEVTDVMQLLHEISKILSRDLENSNVYFDSIQDLIKEINQ